MNQQRNPYICLIVASSLAVSALACIVGIIILDVYGHTPSPSLSAALGTALGALASLLAIVPGSSNGPKPPDGSPRVETR